MIRSLLSKRVRRGLRFDAVRALTRLVPRGDIRPETTRLHLGCGRRRVDGFLNVDVRGSELDVDLASGRLPFADGSFDVVVSQQVIEHLELESELIPLLRELRRVVTDDAEIWLSTPDMERIARSYLADGGQSLLADRIARWPGFSLRGAPPSQIVNELFHQAGEHVNLFDEALLTWTLARAGFSHVERTTEAELLRRFPGFPARDDELCSIYVLARP